MHEKMVNFNRKTENVRKSNRNLSFLKYQRFKKKLFDGLTRTLNIIKEGINELERQITEI